MKRGVYQLLFLVAFIMLLPSVNAQILFSCPSTAQATHPFQVSASDSSATSIKIFWDHTWHQYPSSSVTTSITEGSDKENSTQKYYAESLDSAGNIIDTTFCNVYIDSANFPGSMSVNPASKTLAVNQTQTVTVTATDDDGVHYLKLGGRSYNCYNFGGYPTTCSHNFVVSYTTEGTHTEIADETDKWGNPADTTATFTATVYNPCDSYSCTGSACVDASCKVDSNGNPYCDYQNKPADTFCGSNPSSHCDGQGNCLSDCSNLADALCLSNDPGNTVVHNDHYCSSSRVCYSCMAGYHWDGNDCVEDHTCNNECADGEAQCVGNAVKTCVQDNYGCWVWSNPQDCTAPHPFCTGGSCVECLQTTAGDQYCIDTYDCSYRCASTHTCEKATDTTLCGGVWDSCFFNVSTCSCQACGDTETCNAGVCSQTCDPNTCDHCVEGDCVECTQPSDCNNPPAGKTLNCVSASCQNSACQYTNLPENTACDYDGDGSSGDGHCVNGACEQVCYRDSDSDCYGDPGNAQYMGSCNSGWVSNSHAALPWLASVTREYQSDSLSKRPGPFMLSSFPLPPPTTHNCEHLRSGHPQRRET